MAWQRVVDGVRATQEALVRDGWRAEYLVGEFHRSGRRCAFNWTMGEVQVSVWSEKDQHNRWVKSLRADTEAAEVDMLSTVLGGAYPPVGWEQHGAHR